MGKSAETRRTEYAADKAYEGQVATNTANLEAVDRTNAANLQLANLQNQWNIEQWNRTNEYNSPANQMKLYKQAGLNPALAQGQFSPAQNVESAPLANQVAGHIDNPEAERSSILAQSAMQRAHDKLQALSELPKTFSNIAKNWQEMRKTMVETNVIPRMTEAQIKALAANTNLDELNYNYLKNANPIRLTKEIQDIDVGVANIEYLKTKTKNEKADTDLKRAEEKLTQAYARIKKYEADDWQNMRALEKKKIIQETYNLHLQGKLDEREIAWMVSHGGLSREQSMFNAEQRNKVRIANAQMKNALRIAYITGAGKFAGDVLNFGKNFLKFGKRVRTMRADLQLFEQGFNLYFDKNLTLFPET